MANMPAASENAAVEGVLTPGTTYYASLHSANPGTTGASELSGGGYARQAVVFGSPSGGEMASNAAVTWSNVPAVANDVYAGLYTALTGGTFLWSDLNGITGLSSIPAGANIVAASGAITAQVSG